MANLRGSRLAIRPKKTTEQRMANKLNPSLEPSAVEKQRYELATFRAARKNRFQANTGSGSSGGK